MSKQNPDTPWFFEGWPPEGKGIFAVVVLGLTLGVTYFCVDRIAAAYERQVVETRRIEQAKLFVSAPEEYKRYEAEIVAKRMETIKSVAATINQLHTSQKGDAVERLIKLAENM
jgi:CRISPR/Cas system-associated exonuclease Cas4 (RecB family)